MKTGCSVDPFLNTTLFSTQVATCRFMYLKPNTSPFCGCHQKKRHLIHSTQWFTHVTKKGKYSKFSWIIWQLVPTPWMAVWLLIEHWHLLNAMGVFSLAVWNTTTKITGIFWQGPPLHIYITQHNKIWATWRDWSLISSLYGNMNGSSWQELLCQGAHTAHSQRCFFWWQKNAICLSYKASPDEKFHYCDITCFVPRKTIPLWAHKNNFGEFQHSTSIFQEDQKKKYTHLEGSFFPISGQANINYCFPCVTLLLKPSRPSAPSGKNKKPLWAPGVSRVWTGLWGWYLWYSAIWHFEQGG